MVCQRCRGLLVCETLDDLSSGTDSLYRAAHCINCVCIEDAVVRANRFRRSEKMRVSLRRRVRTGNVERITIPSEAYASGRS
jgi:hypothetical protein